MDVDWKIYDPLKQDGRGQRTEYAEVPQELMEISLKAAQVIGKDIIGFDYIATRDGYRIVDENGRPGLYQHCLDAAGVDIAQEIASLIEKRWKQSLERS